MKKIDPPQTSSSLRSSGTYWAKVWDAPTRLFHWAIVALVVTSYVTAKLGLIEWHFRSGYAVLALVLFRIAWGFAGSRTARFADFLRGPRAALHHLEALAARRHETSVGHNAAGGFMVLALLALLLFQATSGLFSNDGLFVEGPLAGAVGSDLSTRITGWHAVGFNLILAAVALHVAAVLLYGLLLRQDLIRPMITGWKRLPADAPAPRMAPLGRAALLVACAAGLVAAVARLG